MGFLAPKAPPPPPPPPLTPTVDDAAKRRNEADQRTLRRGRATTVLTGDTGLPNLGTTRTLQAGGGGGGQ